MMSRTTSGIGTMPTWPSAYLRLVTRAAVIGFNSQQVIGARMLMMAVSPNDPATTRETQRMVSEKVNAAQKAAMVLGVAGLQLAMKGPTSWQDERSANRTMNHSIDAAYRSLAPYQLAVAANRRRLS